LAAQKPAADSNGAKAFCGRVLPDTLHSDDVACRNLAPTLPLACNTRHVLVAVSPKISDARMVGDNASRSKGVRLLRWRLQLLGFVPPRLRPMAGAAAASSWRESSSLAGGPLSKVNNQGPKEAVCGLRGSVHRRIDATFKPFRIVRLR
jgi:hypothetical protein